MEVRCEFFPGRFRSTRYISNASGSVVPTLEEANEIFERPKGNCTFLKKDKEFADSLSDNVNVYNRLAIVTEDF